MADNISYKDAFIKATVIKDEEGNAKLDIPFQTYARWTVCDGVNYDISLPNELIGKEVIAFVHIKIDEEEEIKKLEGYLGSDWKEVQKNPDVIKHWAVKKEDALAISTESKTEAGKIDVVKYDGADKLDIIHPYAADDVVFKK